MAVLEQWLSEKRGRRVNIKVPQKGMKEKLVELAYKNALLVLSQDKERIKRERGAHRAVRKSRDFWAYMD